MTKTIATHNGGYHADDVFACATLAIYLEQIGQPFAITRTRDESVLKTADYVIDVGAVYVPEHGRFDHHQRGGAGIRDNGIPYAAFGLVWKHYGRRLVERDELVDRIDQKLVQPIDAIDNGVAISEDNFDMVHPYTIHAVLNTFAPTWEEDTNIDQAFQQAVLFAKDIISREIAIVSANLRAEKIITGYYEQRQNERLLVIGEEHVLERGVLVANMVEHPEVLLIIYPHRSGNWHVTVGRDALDSFESRINLPEGWAGLTGEALEKASGVEGALFCHQKRFLCGATTKEGALAMAKIALNKIE